MKNKKGFTLVELMAVIVILAIIIGIAIPSSIAISNKVKKKMYNTKVDMIESSAKIYAQEGNITLGNDEKCSNGNGKVKIKTLVNEGYIKKDDTENGNVLNPIDNSSLNEFEICIYKKNNRINAKFLENSGGVTGDSENKTKLCKRATELHTEICNASACQSDGYSKGDTIKYGNLGSGSSINSGDAFDCDINGDGNFDKQKERFYYVTDMDLSTAILVYYNNVSYGSPSNTASYRYNSNVSGGPTSALAGLPSTSKWSNVSLKSSIRDILDESGTVIVNDFDYGEKAARLLTFQEVKNGCYDGMIDVNNSGGLSSKCKYLMENTIYSNSSNKYGYWLESRKKDTNGAAWSVYANVRSLAGDKVNSTYGYIGVRPTIEVQKSNIKY